MPLPYFHAKIDGQDLATILAALRYYQQSGQGDPANRTDAIHDIATNCGQEVSLDDDGIDGLCIRLNDAQEPSVRESSVDCLDHMDHSNALGALILTNAAYALFADEAYTQSLPDLAHCSLDEAYNRLLSLRDDLND